MHFFLNHHICFYSTKQQIPMTIYLNEGIPLVNPFKVYNNTIMMVMNEKDNRFPTNFPGMCTHSFICYFQLFGMSFRDIVGGF